ncbi:M24 family metallopeptidase, partial [Intestinibacillus massiliensis]|nr:M24 family metallopeptidase [Intestinibacillus massiliensis]
MIIIKSEQEIDIMRQSGSVTGLVLKELESFIKPGVTTQEIDQFVEDMIRDHDMIPSFKGLYGFP